jgi:hypothetical protein
MLKSTAFYSVGNRTSARSGFPSTLAFRTNYKLLLSWVEADREQVGLAADLAIFHILLQRTRGLVNLGGVPLSAIAALEATLHGKTPEP